MKKNKLPDLINPPAPPHKRIIKEDVRLPSIWPFTILRRFLNKFFRKKFKLAKSFTVKDLELLIDHIKSKPDEYDYSLSTIDIYSDGTVLITNLSVGFVERNKELLGID